MNKEHKKYVFIKIINLVDIAENLENDLFLIASTAIEDKL
jgi:hypothetical protein